MIALEFSCLLIELNSLGRLAELLKFNSFNIYLSDILITRLLLSHAVTHCHMFSRAKYLSYVFLLLDILSTKLMLSHVVTRCHSFLHVVTRCDYSNTYYTCLTLRYIEH